MEINDYYPFGLKWYSNGTSLNKYKFGGKELQTELNLNTYDFHARQQDPQLGRFWGVDPLSEQRNWTSPFNFVQNNPISRIDPSGMSDDWVENIATDNYEWKDNVTSDKNTPEGFRYIGSNDRDILRDLKINDSFMQQVSKRFGYIAADVEPGSYAVNHMVGISEMSNLSITADISYNLKSGTENNRLGRKFEGIKVSASVLSSSSNVDGVLNVNGNLNVDYGNQHYSSSLAEPRRPYLIDSKSQMSVASISIPTSNLNPLGFSNITINGSWWVTNSSNFSTPVVYHPLVPLPQTFSHKW